MSRTTIESMDFESFLKKHQPTKNDFVFFDPPYDSNFSTYAENKFNLGDQSRLARYLIKKCKAKWMIIIKKTEFVYSLYKDQGLTITSFDKKYKTNMKKRNNQNVEHLIITNY